MPTTGVWPVATVKAPTAPTGTLTADGRVVGVTAVVVGAEVAGAPSPSPASAGARAVVTVRAGEVDGPTAPYFRSTYVFVSRDTLSPPVTSLDDPRLRRLRIGVHLIGDDYTNTPPAHALARRGIIRNVAGYTIYGDYSEPNPPARLVEAVAKGEIDVAVVWGPFGGYFAPRQGAGLQVTPVLPASDGPALPFQFDISAGVRRGNDSLRMELDRVFARRAREIGAILREYRIPLVEGTARAR